MSYRDQLVREINEHLDDLAAARKPWVASWVAHEICRAHSAGLSPDVEDSAFWQHCGYATCRDEVRRCINKRAGDKPDADEQQSLMPGFDHLQRYYVVVRNKKEVGIPVDELSDEELDAKAMTYRSMGKACFAHAKEIERFKEERTSPPLFPDYNADERTKIPG